MDFPSISHWLLLVLPFSRLSFTSGAKFSSRGSYAVVMWDRSNCHYTYTVKNPIFTDTLTTLKNKQCTFSYPKECSVTYEVPEVLSKAYVLCGYFNDMVISNSCDSSIKMSDPSGQNPDDFKTLSCNSKPVKHCTSGSGRRLLITLKGKNWCMEGDMKIQLEPKYPNTVVLFAPERCMSNPVITNDQGTILSRRDEHSNELPNSCNMTLLPSKSNPRFCFEFVYYLTGADLQINVDDQKMRFGHGKVPSGKVCQAWNGQTPVEVNVVRGEIKSRDPFAHFYLLRYSFEKENEDNEEDYSGRNKDGGSGTGGGSGGLVWWHIALICIGLAVVAVLILVFIRVCVMMRWANESSERGDGDTSKGQVMHYNKEDHHDPSSQPLTT